MVRSADWSGWWLVLGVSTIVTGCLRVDPFLCEGDDDCVLDGRAGRCEPNAQVCLYPDPGCATQWSAAGGECMSPVAGTSSTSTGTMSDDAGSTHPGPDPTTGGQSACDQGVATDITAQGLVSASSVFADEFPPELAVDGAFTTSWFAAGVDIEGNPSSFQWTMPEPRCIARATVVGNAMHEDPTLREGFGYGSMIVRVYDESDLVVFQRMVPLPGTPDPDGIVEPEVVGVRLELELFDHETFNRGGFSELIVQGS